MQSFEQPPTQPNVTHPVMEPRVHPTSHYLPVLSVPSNGHLWSSLHDPDPATPAVGYRWQLLEPLSCLALSSESWTHWFDNEPLNPKTSLCIKLEWDKNLGYRWRSENCGASLLKVICRASGGEIWTCPCHSGCLCHHHHQSLNRDVSLGHHR